VGKKNGKRLQAEKVIDFNSSEGRRLIDIETLWGDNFVKFHHDLFRGIFNEYEKSIIDESLWIKKNGGGPKFFYEKFFSLFICYGVLFENYLENKNEKEFTNNLVIPTFKKVYEIFGLKPLVVKIYPPKNENDLFWRHYPKEVENNLNNMKCKKDSIKLEVKESGKYGKGVFAGEDIKMGQVINILEGEIISLEECSRRIFAGKLNPDDPLQVDNELYIILETFPRTFNHSCDPSAGLRKKNELFALRDIKSGEEITYDYSVTVDPSIPAELWTMECKCESKHCRKVLGNILTIPSKRLDRYKELGALQDYMKEALKKKTHKNAMEKVIKIKDKNNVFQSNNKH